MGVVTLRGINADVPHPFGSAREVDEHGIPIVDEADNTPLNQWLLGVLGRHGGSTTEPRNPRQEKNEQVLEHLGSVAAQASQVPEQAQSPGGVWREVCRGASTRSMYCKAGSSVVRSAGIPSWNLGLLSGCLRVTRTGFQAYFSPFLRILKGNSQRVRINQSIRAREVRVIGAGGENLGVISVEEALRHAADANLDLIEISPTAKPPVAKIMDYGKYQYEQKKRAREMKAKAHVTETKSVQVKIGTGENDLNLKAKRVANWLGEGHRVKVDLFLWGRYKYMEESFLKERLERFLKLVPADYKIGDPIKRSPKGFTTTLERA